MDTSVPLFSVAGDPTYHKNCNFLSEIYNFSNEVDHFPGESATQICYIINDFYFQDIISLKIYANGNSIENKGYVSLFIEVSDMSLLSCLSPLFEFSCVMSVVDVTGYQRFPRSLTIQQKCFQKGKKKLFGFDKFVERETLLSEQSDLLPNDNLTIHLYCNVLERIHNEPRPFLQAENVLDSSFEEMKGRPGGRVGKLFFDSVLFKKLSEVSEYFQRLLETPMKEKQDGFIEISFPEFSHLKTFGLMIMRQCYRSLDIYDICTMYVIAHRYLLDFVLDICRESMEIMLSPENVLEISKCAMEYEDSYLKEIVDNFQRTTNEGATEADIENCYLSHDKERYRKLDYTRYVLCVDESSEDKHPDFDFYK